MSIESFFLIFCQLLLHVNTLAQTPRSYTAKTRDAARQAYPGYNAGAKELLQAPAAIQVSDGLRGAIPSHTAYASGFVAICSMVRGLEAAAMLFANHIAA